MRLIRNRRLVVRESHDNLTFLFDPKTGEIFTLEDTAKEIWDLCEQHNFDEIISRMAEKYPDIDSDQLKLDIQEFVDDMISNELIEYDSHESHQ